MKDEKLLLTFIGFLLGGYAAIIGIAISGAHFLVDQEELILENSRLRIYCGEKCNGVYSTALGAPVTGNREGKGFTKLRPILSSWDRKNIYSHKHSKVQNKPEETFIANSSDLPPDSLPELEGRISEVQQNPYGFYINTIGSGDCKVQDDGFSYVCKGGPIPR